MEKYIFIIVLILNNTAWPMDHEKRFSQPIRPDSLEKTIHSFQTAADRKEGWKTLDNINEKTGILSQKTNPNASTVSNSSLFIMHNERSSKL
jgi:hypothetical protein